MFVILKNVSFGVGVELSAASGVHESLVWDGWLRRQHICMSSHVIMHFTDHESLGT